MNFEFDNNSGPGHMDWTRHQEHADEALAAGERMLWEQPRVPWDEAEVPRCAGVYIVWAEGFEAPRYIGESTNLRRRHRNHDRTTGSSALRRNVGREVFGFALQSKRFTPEEDAQVTDYLALCRYAFLPVSIGRKELEEFLVAKHRPQLNRKGKRKARRREVVRSG
jgi:hypothetical protein